MIQKRHILCAWRLLVGSTVVQSAETETKTDRVEVSGEWRIHRAKQERKMTFGDFLNNVTFPLEFGCAWTPKLGHERPGFYARTSLEYRDKKTASWCVGIEYDAYTRKYDDMVLSKSNLSHGSDWTMDILAGAGYRFPLVKNIRSFLQQPLYDNIWSIGLMLFAGASDNMVETVKPDPQHIGCYKVEEVDTWVPSIKMTANLEYSICYGISLYTTLGYMRHLMPLLQDPEQKGNMIWSLGLTCFFR